MYELEGYRDPKNARLHDHPRRPTGEWLAVNSSWVKRVRYVGAGSLDRCDLETLGNKMYGIYDMPWSVFWRWSEAPSKGVFFNAQVKGKYEIVPL